MAFDEVNNHDKFIYNSERNTSYKFVVTIKEVSKERRDVVEAMYSMFYDSKYGPIVSVIGPPYNHLTTYTSDYAIALGTYTISYRESYEPWPRSNAFYRQTSPRMLSKYETGRVITDRFNWRKVGIIFDYSEGLYHRNVDMFRNEITKKKSGENSTINVLSEHGIWSNLIDYKVTKEFDDFQETGVRIIFALVSIAGARKVFCEAYEREMIAPKVIWVLFEILPHDWASDKYMQIVIKLQNNQNVK